MYRYFLNVKVQKRCMEGRHKKKEDNNTVKYSIFGKDPLAVGKYD